MYKLAFEEGRRKVDDQLGELVDMRNRSVQFLGLSSTASAFLIGTALKDAQRDGFFYFLAGAGTVTAIVALLQTLRVLLGWRRVLRLPHVRYAWRFRLSSRMLVDWAGSQVPPAPSENAYTKELALEYHEMSEQNRPQLQELRGAYTAAIACGFTQIVLWGLLVWIRA